MKTKLINRFELRLESFLFEKIEKKAEIQQIKKNKLIQNALKSMFEYYKRGLFHFLNKSDFLNRTNTSDKKRFQVILHEDDKERLLKLAFTMRLSQAETLRMAIEHYLYVILSENEVLKEKYLQKFRYTARVCAPMLVIYEITRAIEEKYFMFSNPPPYKLGFS